MQVDLIDSMGSDLTVVNAARVSFNKESNWENGEPGGDLPLVLKEQDERLIYYLASHNHWTPFAHCFATFRIKAPTFVARQLVKHSVGLAWNEVSRRYVDTEPELYWPDQWRGRPENSIKQGSGDYVEVNDRFTKYVAGLAKQNYQDLLENGVSPEYARMVLPLNTYTEWYWSGSLAAWSRVLNLRLKPDAQEQTRFVAQEIHKHLKELFPVSCEALIEVV